MRSRRSDAGLNARDFQGKGPRVDGEQGIAFVYFLAFGEMDFVQRPGDACPDIDGVDYFEPRDDE